MHPRDRVLRIIRRVGELIVDIEVWNAYHPHLTPLDCELDRIVLHAAGQAICEWDGGDQDAFYRLARLMEQQAAEWCKA